MKLTAVKTLVTSKFGRQVLQVRKHSPVLLFGAGIVGVVATAVLASRATLKLDETLDETNYDLDRIRDSVIHENYSETDRQRDMAIVYAKAAGKVARLYGPSMLIGMASVAALTGSHVILTRRNTAIMAAYAVLDRGWREYRARVVNELGVDKDLEFRHGTTLCLADEVDVENGITPGTIVGKMVGGASVYARFFDEFSPNWEKAPGYNSMFLSCQQNFANDLLRSRGHVFLNDVYDMLGIPRSKEGAVAGWIYDLKNKEIDNRIDFGIFDVNQHEGMRFVLGHNDAVLLDFNVDGLIWDKI